MGNNKNINLDETLRSIKALSPRRLSGHLEALLEHSIAYEKKLSELCREVCRYDDNPEELEELLTELSDAGELYCLRRRSVLDAMLSAIPPKDFIGAPPAREMDLSQDIHISYDAESNTLKIVMPGLLPLKGKWNSFLPEKIRSALKQFDRKYREQHGKTLKISPAFVLFIHHYGGTERQKGYYRDYDNQEYSAVLNALHSTGIFNDSAATFINTQMAVPDKKSFTEVIVTNVERMPEVLGELDFSLYV